MRAVFVIGCQEGGPFSPMGPHHVSLNKCSEGKEIFGFPKEELAILLRIDGRLPIHGSNDFLEVKFPPYGPGYLKKGKNYISVDIGFSKDDYNDEKMIAEKMVAYLKEIPNFFKTSKKFKTGDINYDALIEAIDSVCEEYIDDMKNG